MPPGRKQASVFIDGEVGATYLSIRDRLRNLPIVLRSIDPPGRADPQTRRALMAEVDLVVLCQPRELALESAQLAAGLGADAPKLIDASTAHGGDPDWTYGFPELTPHQPDAIARAERVANPGSSATAAIALLRPLVDAGVLPPSYPLTIAVVSGYSGGGRRTIEAYERKHGSAFELHGLDLEHDEMPELLAFSGLTRRPVLLPSVGRFRQGMLVAVPLHLDLLDRPVSGADLRAVLADRYRSTAHVRVMPAEPTGSLAAEALNETDVLELRVFVNEAHRQALLVAQLDNLGKGASGAAVQNVALMLGLETAEELPLVEESRDA